MKKILEKVYNKNEVMDSKGRIYYFDNLKFILIFLVVLGHFLDPLTKTSECARGIWLFIAFFHMPLFIFVSGYFARKTIDRKDKGKIFIFFALYIILTFALFIVSKFIYNTEVKFSILNVKNIPWYLLAMAVWYGFSMATQNLKKKNILIVTIILALVIGYDKSFGDYLALSRIIVFYPFFLLGTMVDKEKINTYIINNKFKMLFVVLLTIVFAAFIFFINKIYFLRPLTTARNSYFSFSDDIENYGILFRCLWYVMSLTIGLLFMIAVPKGKTFFSKLGERTLSVYFWHAIVIKVWGYYDINFRVLEYIALSTIVTFVLSLKIFSLPFEKAMKIKFLEK